MGNLIITIVSIALIVVVSLATMSYLGDTTTQGRTSADAAAFVNTASQISGAATMFAATESAAPADVAALVTSNHLSSIPNVKSRSATNEWTLVPAVAGTSPRMVTINLAGTPASNQQLCNQINKNAGGTGMDATSGTVAAMGALAYACVAGASGTDPQVFQFKY